MTDTHLDVTIGEVMRSLEQRGFYGGMIDLEGVQTQVDAVIEELGEVARLLRRNRQQGGPLDLSTLQAETADVVIAAVCLGAMACGFWLPQQVAGKLAADEQRGFLHNG